MTRARRISLLIVPLLAACGGPLEGERALEPVADWSFVREADDLELATPQGRRFRMVEAEPLVHEGKLYLVAATIFSRDDAALLDVLAGNGVELRAGGRVYALRATRLTTPADIDPLLPKLVREGAHIEATGLRWNPTPERYPGTQMRRWFFRLESRDL